MDDRTLPIPSRDTLNRMSVAEILDYVSTLRSPIPLVEALASKLRNQHLMRMHERGELEGELDRLAAELKLQEPQA